MTRRGACASNPTVFAQCYRAQKVGASAGKQLPYWSTAGGNNTMYSIWNTTAGEQSVVLKLMPATGTNTYELAISLVPGASVMVDVGMLRAEGMTDRNGNLLPPDAESGSAMLEPAGIPKPNSNGVIIMPRSGIPMMRVAVSTGVFNAQDGTCGVYSGRCCFYGNHVVTTSASTVNQGQTFTAEMWATSCGGRSVNLTLASNWGGSSGATPDGYGSNGDPQFMASTPGGAYVWFDDPTVVLNPGTPYDCTCGCYVSDIYGSADVSIAPVITGPTDVWWFGGVNPSGYATSITLSASSGSSYQWNIDAGGSEISTSGLTGSTLTLSSSGSEFSTGAGDVHISITVNGVTSAEFGLTTHEPYKLVPSATPPAVVDMSSGTYGYESDLYYEIVDQLGSLMSAPVPSPIYNGGPPGEPIIHRSQTIWVGSTSSGAGVRVQSDVLQKYINCGRHLSIVPH